MCLASRIDARRLLTLFLVMACLCAARAKADARIALHWARGPGAEACISPAELTRALGERTGATFAETEGATQILEGTVLRAPRGFSVTLRVSDEHGVLKGERSFAQSGDDCDALVRPLLLVIGLLLDPHMRWDAEMPTLFGPDARDHAALLLEEIENESKKEPSTVPALSAPPSVVPRDDRSSPPEPARPESTLALDTMGGIGIDHLARFAMRARLDVAIKPQWLLETGAFAEVPRSHAVGDEGSLQVATFAGWFGGCPIVVGQGLRLELCAGGALGAQHLTTRKVVDAVDTWAFLLGTWFDARVRKLLSPKLGLSAGALAYIPFIHARPTVDLPGSPRTPVFDPLPISGSAYLGGFFLF